MSILIVVTVLVVNMENYKYIGTGEVKYLDNKETKLGAFFNVNIDTLLDALKQILDEKPNTSEVLIYALPNKTGTHSVKIKL